MLACNSHSSAAVRPQFSPFFMTSLNTFVNQAIVTGIESLLYLYVSFKVWNMPPQMIYFFPSGKKDFVLKDIAIRCTL